MLVYISKVNTGLHVCVNVRLICLTTCEISEVEMSMTLTFKTGQSQM